MQTKTRYQLRLLNADDTTAVADLWTMSFGPPFHIHDPVNYAEQQLSYLVGAFSDGKLQAAAGITDFDLHIEDRWLKAGGIAAVATNPAHRRQGVVDSLLRNCVEHLHESGVGIACLWPFSYGFYEHFGWSTTDMQYSIQIALQGLHKLGDARQYKLAALHEFETLMPMHQTWCQQFNMSLSRVERRWLRWLFNPDFVGRMFIHPEGYMILDLLHSKDRKLVIREWAYLSSEAFADGLALLGQMDSQFDTVTWNDGQTEPLLKAGIFDAITEIKLKPGMMSRVVNVESLSAALKLPLTDYPVHDPLGVSTQNVSQSESTKALSPGQLMHLVCGSPADPSTSLLPLTKRNYSAEHF